MAYLKAGMVRSMNKADREARLADLRKELMHERGVAAMGGSPPSPGKIRQLRRQVARILTINREDALGLRRTSKKPATARKSGSEKPGAKKAPEAKTAAKEGAPGGHE